MSGVKTPTKNVTEHAILYMRCGEFLKRFYSRLIDALYTMVMPAVLYTNEKLCAPMKHYVDCNDFDFAHFNIKMFI